MKTLFSPVAVAICALSAASVNAQQAPAGVSRELDPGEQAKLEITSIKAMRAEEDRKLAGARFEEECVTISDASDRLLYEHEETVNRFLSMSMKMGLGRVLAAHYSNPKLASHGGIIRSVFNGDEGWNTNGNRYALTRPWGLIGALNEPVAQAWLFRRSPFLSSGKKNAPSELPKPEAYALNRFEEYALGMLRKGEKLVRWEREDVMLAVGAVRAEAVCLRCHDGAAGDLLGAFTYSYAKSKAVELDAQTKQILQWNREGQKLDQIASSLNLFEKSLDGKASGRMHRYQITQALLGQGIVTAEMLEMQAGMRHHVLQTDLGPTKKPGTGGAE